MFNIFKSKENEAVEEKPKEYVRYDIPSCEKYVFSVPPLYVADWTVNYAEPYRYELFKSEGKLFLSIMHVGQRHVYSFEKEHYNSKEVAIEIRKIMQDIFQFNKDSIDFVIGEFMKQGLVHITHFY